MEAIGLNPHKYMRADDPDGRTPDRLQQCVAIGQLIIDHYMN